jgi:hypothetical protein
LVVAGGGDEQRHAYRPGLLEGLWQ